ncbi:phage integrase N-terminal domain-containing protein [Brenneria corticis]
MSRLSREMQTLARQVGGSHTGKPARWYRWI